MPSTYHNRRSLISRGVNRNVFHLERQLKSIDSGPFSVRSRSSEAIPYVNIVESEVSNIVGRAVQAGFMETGGVAFGLFTRFDRPVIFYATGPGPNSIQKYSLFQQDPNFVKKVSQYMFQEFGVQIVARAHSHHQISHPDLSRQDNLSSYLFSSANGYQTFCELLITFENSTPQNPGIANLNRRSKKTSIMTYLQEPMNSTNRSMCGPLCL